MHSHPEFDLARIADPAQIDEARALGAVQILIQGGHNPYIPFQWYLDLMAYIKRNHPIHIHGFSPSEIDFFAKLFRMEAIDVSRGCNDFGSLMIEENVISAANTTHRTTTAEMERLISDAGFRPVRRRQDYSLIESAANAA